MRAMCRGVIYALSASCIVTSAPLFAEVTSPAPSGHCAAYAPHRDPDGDLFGGLTGRWHLSKGLPILAHALKRVGLSVAQKEAVRAAFRHSMEEAEKQYFNLSRQRVTFEASIPGTKDFSDAYTSYLEAATAFAEGQVQRDANLRTEIFGLLSNQQRHSLVVMIGCPVGQ